MKTKLSFALLLSFIFGLWSSYAQVPQGFNYQAIARDGSGNILQGTSLQVMLYIQSSPTGGTVFWKELHNPVTTNNFGLFTVVVGTGVRQTGSQATTFDQIDWKVSPKYLKTEIYYSGSWKNMGDATQLYAVPYAMAAKDLTGTGKLSIKGTTAVSDTNAIFEVKNVLGQTVFAVYPEGVRIHVDDGKGQKGGFAVGGFDQTKGYYGQEYLRITKDSARIYVNNNPAKGQKGGFAVGGFDQTKASPTLFTSLTPQNYFIGHESGLKTDPKSGGLYNSFFGYQAGRINTTGYNNVFLGYRAGFSNSSGWGNVFIGNLAGTANTTGFFNIYIGEYTGMSSTTAARNVFIGQYAGRTNTTGQANVFIGQQTGEYNVGGSFNLFAGRNAGNFNTEGQLNTFLGINAGNGNTTGNDNVNLGGESGKQNSTGSNNVNLGTGAGYGNTNGNDNIIIGHYAGVSLTSGSGNIFIGPGAGGGLSNASNKLFIENSYADVNNALIYGEFDNNKLRFNAGVGINTDAGALKLYVYDNTASNDNTAILGQHDITPYYGIGVKGVGGFYGVLGEATAAGAGSRFGVYGNATGGAYNYGVFGSASGGTAAYAGYFNGNVYVNGVLTQASDRRLKKNIIPLSGSLSRIIGLQGVSFEWRSGADLENSDIRKNSDRKPNDIRSFNLPEGMQIGVIAQDVEKVFPELVRTDADGIKSVDYIQMIPLLIESVKEQQKIIESQNARIEKLEALIEKLLSAK